MLDRKKIFAIVLFLAFGLVIFTFANPGNAEGLNPATQESENQDDTEGGTNPLTPGGEIVDELGDFGTYTETILGEETLVRLSWEPVGIMALLFNASEQEVNVGQMTITKVIKNGDTVPTEKFEFTISGTDTKNAPLKDIVVTLDPTTDYVNGVFSKTINLEYGTYTIKETNSSDYYSFDSFDLIEGLEITNVKDDELSFAINDASRDVKVTATNAATTIEVSKSSEEGKTYKVGDIVTYEIKVENTGNVAAKNVVVKDTVPANLEITSHTEKDESGNVILGTIAKLASKSSTTFTVKAKVISASEVGENIATITNIATAKGENTPEDEDDDVITTNPKVVIEKTSNPISGSLVKTGSKITYTLTVKNISLGIATNVVITDKLDNLVTLDETSISNYGDIYNATNHTITYAVGTLNGGQEASITFDVIVNDVADEDNGKVIKNTGRVDYTTPDGEPDGDDSEEVTHTIAKPILSRSKASNTKNKSTVEGVEIGKVVRGEEITYTIKVKNTGTADATGVKITDTIPANTTYVDGSASNGIAPVNNKLTWTVDVPVGEDGVTVSFTVKVDDDITSGTYIRNKAYVNDVPTNEVVDRVLLPNVSYKKTADKSRETGIIVRRGDNITYTITVENTGEAISDPIKVTDEIPLNTTFVEIDSSSDYDGELKTKVVNEETVKYVEFDSFQIPAKGKVKLSFTVKVTGDVKIGDKIYNTAEVNEDPTNTVITDVEGKIDVKINKISTVSANIVLVIDLSTSMNDGTKIADAKKVLKDFIDHQFKNDTTGDVLISVVGFNRGVTVVPGLTALTNKTTGNTYNKNTVDRLIDNLPTAVYTNMYGGLNEGYNQLKHLRTLNSKNKDVIIFLGDGDPVNPNRANAGEDFSKNNETGITNLATTIKNDSRKPHIYTIGFGLSGTVQNNTAKRILFNMASNSKSAYDAKDNGQDIFKDFNAIMHSIQTEEVEAQSDNGQIKFKIDENLLFNEDYPITIKVGTDQPVIIESSEDLKRIKMEYKDGYLYWYIGDLTEGDSEISLAITYYVY